MTINNQFIKEYQHVVLSVLKQYHYPHIQQDLLQEGYLGLIEAARHYKPEYGILFSSYAVAWIRRQIQFGIHQYAYLMCMPTHPKKDYLQLASVSYDQPLYKEDGDVITLSDDLPDDIDLDALLDRDLAKENLLEILSEREQLIIKYYYGIDAPQLTVEQIAQVTGLNFWNVHKIFQRAVKKIKENTHKVSKKV